MKYIRVKYFLFLYRIALLKIRYHKKVHIASLKLGIESQTQIIISDQGSSISFGQLNYFYRYGNLEVYNGGEIIFGNNVSVNKGFSIVCRSKIIFGNNIMIGPNVMIYDHDHNFQISEIPFQQQGFKSAPVIFGNNIWIGANVFISSGITVGNNVVIAAGSIVTKSIPPNTVVGGNPARILKELNG